MTGRSRADSLTPPTREHTEDPGAHELADSSDSEDHFSDARSVSGDSVLNSPIPKTRVEKVSDEPSYGEVPGTEAYRLREGDALPDEIAIMPNSGGGEARGSAETVPSASPARPSTPGDRPIPKTVVESADGDGAKTPEGKNHLADPLPDVIVKADGTREGGSSTTDDAPVSPPAVNSSASTTHDKEVYAAAEADVEPSEAEEDGKEQYDADDNNDEDDDFGDDFDDFEDGANNKDDDDFGDFDDGFQDSEPQPLPSEQAQQQPQQLQQTPTPPQPQPALPFPIPDFDSLDAGEVLKTVAPYLNGLYLPDGDIPPPPPLSKDAGTSVFLTPRSASLWAQLVAPPPLQPPDWIRSRIRRLFLVSLGVPVDLDEILPASKQKKLILPSLSLSVPRGDSPRTSTEGRGGGPASSSSQGQGTNRNGGAAAGGAVTRLKGAGANNSNTSVDSQGRPKESSASSSRKRKGPPPPPQLDLVAGRQLCMTTDEALDGMTDGELKAHVRKLEALEVSAKQVLEYWTKRTDDKIGERETFEGVIENLVKHARKTRK